MKGHLPTFSLRNGIKAGRIGYGGSFRVAKRKKIKIRAC